MMEKPDPGEGHDHVVLIAGLYHMIVTDGAAGLCDIEDTASSCTLDIVTKGEEGIGAEAYAAILFDPGLSCFAGEDLGLFGEEILPVSVSYDILIILTGIEIDRIVSVSTANLRLKGQIQNLRRLTKPPLVSLITGQTGAVDPGLLACSDTDRLAAFDIADGIGLGILQSDHGDGQIDLSAFRQILVLCHNIIEEIRTDMKLISALLEGDTEDLLLLDRIRDISRIDLNHIVISLLLGL